MNKIYPLKTRNMETNKDYLDFTITTLEQKIAEVKKLEPTTEDGYATVLNYLAGFLRGTSDNIVERFTIKKGGK